MAREVINVGTAPNDGTGDPIRTSFIKCNNNFGELYSRVQTNPPASLVGTIGDQAGMYAYDPNYFYYCFQDYDGSSVIWAEITQIGNAAVQSIVNGTTSVAIPVSNGNITMNVGGTANVGVWSTNRLTMTGDILPSGNALYDLGSASRQWRSLYVSNSSIWINDVQLTVQGNSLQVAGANVLTVSGNNNISVGNITGTNLTVTNATVSNVLTINNDLSVSDALTVGGVATAGFFVGDGSGLTNLPGGGGNGGPTNQIINGFSRVFIPLSSGNIQVDVGLSAGILEFTNQGLDINGTLTLAGNVNAVNSTGNVTAPYFIGDGSQLTNISGTGVYGNSQVAQYLPTYSGNLSGNNITVTNTANANIVYANAVSATAVNATTIIGSLTGNVTGDLVGNTQGIHTGYVGSIDILELSWDWGTIDGTVINPITWLINNIAGGFDAGTILAPNATNIEIGVLTN